MSEPAVAARPSLLARVPAGGTRDTDEILDRFLGWVGDLGLEPYPHQEEAFLELMLGRHVVLSTPTGSGKSLVALCLHFKALCEGQRSFYTAPLKALASEKFFSLCEDLGPETVGMLTGDASINPTAPVVCCTAEVLANMALRQGAALAAPYVVMDEFHFYADRDRGAAWQIPLLALPRTRFLLMSATLGNTAAIEERLEEAHGRRGRARPLRRAAGAARFRVSRDADPRDGGGAGRAEPRAGLRRELHAARVRRAGAGAHQRELLDARGARRGSPRRSRAPASTRLTART